MRALNDVLAPAKINLFLHIVGRRADGYHLMQSAFVMVDWFDTLHFEWRQDGKISREDLTSPLPADDLIVRAAHALKGATQCPYGAHIGVSKNIPAEAGLGGGSSDCASTLLALNRLWSLNLTLAELAPIGEKLGADVPFFLGGHNAWVEGIGEQLHPISVPPATFLLAKPPAGVSTPAIFSHPDLKRDSELAIISVFAEEPFGFGRNDLQSVAEALCPAISDTVSWLQTLGLQARMTGSGSAVFAQTTPQLAAQVAALYGSSAPNGAPNGATSSAPSSAPSGAISGAPSGLLLRSCQSLEVHPLWGWAHSKD